MSFYQTLATGVRAVSEGYETYRLFASEPRFSPAKLRTFNAFRIAMGVTAVADGIFFAIRLAGRRVSPYIEFSFFAVRLYAIAASNSCYKKEGGMNADCYSLWGAISDSRFNQKVTMACETISGLTSLFFPKAADYIDVMLLIPEFGARGQIAKY